MDKWKAAALVLGGLFIGSWAGAPTTTSATEHQQFEQCSNLCSLKRGGVVKPSKLEKQAISIPAGWTVVSASGGDETACVLLCR